MTFKGAALATILAIALGSAFGLWHASSREPPPPVTHERVTPPDAPSEAELAAATELAAAAEKAEEAAEARSGAARRATEPRVEDSGDETILRVRCVQPDGVRADDGIFEVRVADGRYRVRTFEDGRHATATLDVVAGRTAHVTLRFDAR